MFKGINQFLNDNIQLITVSIMVSIVISMWVPGCTVKEVTTTHDENSTTTVINWSIKRV